MTPFLRLADKIAADNADVNILVLGDSTTESYNEWAGECAQLLAAQYATHTFEWEAYWNSSAEDWGDTRTVQTGTGSHTVKFWVGAGGGWGLTEATAAGVLDHPSAVDYVVTYIGINGVTESEWDTGLAAIQAEWPSAHITIGVQGPTSVPYDPPTEDWDTPNSFLSQIIPAADRWGLPYVDVAFEFVRSHVAGVFDLDDIITDGVHPNAEGSAFIASQMYGAFQGGAGVVTLAGTTPDLLVRASNYGGSGDWLDETGNGHNADVTGLRWREYRGSKTIYLPGITSNMVTTPNFDLTGSNVEIEAKIAPDDWTTGSGYGHFLFGYRCGWTFST